MKKTRSVSYALVFALLASLAPAETPRRLPASDGSPGAIPIGRPLTAAEASDPEGATSIDPAVTPAAYQPLIGLASCELCEPGKPRFEVGALFDKGIFLRGTDLERDPYAMYLGARAQLRHTGFVRSEETWTDSAGVTRTIRNRNNFESERMRLNISGTAIDPAMTYYFVLDGDADGASNVDMLVSFFNYKFDDKFQVRFGRWKVAADREWLLSSRYSTLVDRSMATEFFRVGFSDGIWLIGDMENNWRYEMSLTNGLRTSNRRAFSLDDNLGAAATVYWDALGPFGPGMVDYAHHDDPVVRVGGSFAVNKADDRSDVGFPSGDNNFVRLSDGTRLSDVGALGPDANLLGDRILEGAIDYAVKWRGWFLSTEVFVRSIQDLTADRPIAFSEINDYGFRCDWGKFLVPKRLDVIGRVSNVAGGPFGDAWEYAAGFNYYWGSGSRDGVLSDRINKFSMDVTLLDGNPVTSGPSDLVAGDTGVLFRSQMQIGF